MKIACTMATLLLLLSVPSMAQDGSGLYFFVNGGISQPQAPDLFNDGWRDGTSIGGGVGYRFSQRLSVQALVTYDSLELDGERLLDEAGSGSIPGLVDVNIRGGDASVLSLSGELKVSLREGYDRVSPYVTVGAGVADVNLADVTISTSLFGIEIEETMEGMSETAAMATAGLGLDIPLSERFGAFVEGRYQTNLTKGDATNLGSLRAGIRIGRR